MVTELQRRAAPWCVATYSLTSHLYAEEDVNSETYVAVTRSSHDNHSAWRYIYIVIDASLSMMCDVYKLGRRHFKVHITPIVSTSVRQHDYCDWDAQGGSDHRPVPASIVIP